MRKFAAGLAIALITLHALPLQAMGEVAASPAPQSPAPRSLRPSQRQILEQIAQLVPKITEPDTKAFLLLWLSGFYYGFDQAEQSNLSQQQALATVRTLEDGIPKATLLARILEAQISLGQKEQAEQLLPEFLQLLQSLPEPTENSLPLYNHPFTLPEANRPLNSVIAAYASAGEIETALRLTQQVREPSALIDLVQNQLREVLSQQERYGDAIAIIQRISTFSDPATGESIANPTPDQILQTRIESLLNFGANISFRSPGGVAPPESHVIYHVAQQWIEQITDPTTRFNQRVELVRDRGYQKNFGEEATANLRQLLETIPTVETLPPEERARLLTDLIRELRAQNPDDPLVQRSSETLQQLIESLPETEAGLALKARLWRNMYCGCDRYSEAAQRSLQTLLDAEAWNTTTTGKKQKADFLITLASSRAIPPSDAQRFIQQATEIASSLPIADRAELLLKIAQCFPLENNPTQALNLITPLVEQAQAIATVDQQQNSRHLNSLITVLIKLNQVETAATIVTLIKDPSSRYNAWEQVANAQDTQPEALKKTIQAAIASASSNEVNNIPQALTQMIAIYIRATSPEEGMKILDTLPSLSLKIQVSGGLAAYQANHLLSPAANGAATPYGAYWRSLIPQLPTVEEQDREWARLAFINLLMRQPDTATALESIEHIQSIAQKTQMLMLLLSLEL
jgi:tetratricopeptide (TPR) repeat protein